MLTIKHLLFAVAVAVSLMAGFFMARHFQIPPAVAHATASVPDDQALQLCERLIRFGQAAYVRGRYAEAKHFFQKAITVYPDHVAAWKKYNMALLSQISARVETDPAFLPEPRSGTAPARPSVQPRETTPGANQADDGC